MVRESKDAYGGDGDGNGDGDRTARRAGTGKLLSCMAVHGTVKQTFHVI